MSLRQKILEDTSHLNRIDFEVLLLTELFIEYAKGSDISAIDAEIAGEFEADPPTATDLVRIKENLASFIYHSPTTLILQQAIATLGKIGDQDVVTYIKPFLHRYLRHLLEVNTVIYASMVALDECGEAIFSRDHYGLAEYNENIKDARNYINRHYHIQLPG